MTQCLVDRRFQVGEIDWLCQKVECPPVHRGAYICHVAIRGDDHGGERLVRLLELFEQCQTVHSRHIDVAHHHVDRLAIDQCLKRFDAVASEYKFDFSVPNLAAELLLDEGFNVRLVVDDEDCRGHT